MIFFWGVFDLVIGVLDMHYDLDFVTYLWFGVGIFFVVIGYISKK